MALRTTIAIGAAACAVALTGCGSNVSTASAPQPSSGVGDQGLAAPTGAPSAGPSAAGVGAAAGNSNDNGAGGSGVAPVAGSAGTGAASPTSRHVITTKSGRRVVVGQGVTATAVKIGVPYTSDAGAADQATGSQGIDPGNTRAEFQALWDHINRHGGLGGRKAVLDFYEIPATTPNAQQAFQAACAHFTQDQHDFAVINAGTRNFSTCLEKGGALHIASDLTVSSKTDVTALPHNLQPAGVTMEDAARTLVDGLNDMGYFKTGKTAILSFDDPEFRTAVDSVMKPEMARVGHPAADTFFVRSPNSVADYGNMSQDCTTAAVRFRAKGITNVILWDANGRLATFFPDAAEAQHAHFNLGINSQSGMQVGLDSGNVQKDQVVGSMGVGWLPLFDVAQQYQPKNELKTKCLDFFRKAGYPASNSNAEVIEEFMCQDAWTLQKIVGSLTTVITRDSALAVANQLGGGVPNVANYAARLDARHHDGAAELQLYAYDATGCSCYKPYPAPAIKLGGLTSS